MVCRIKKLLFLLLASCIPLGFGGCSEDNATIMKFGIMSDVDLAFYGNYIFELKKDQVLYVTSGGVIYEKNDIYNPEKDGSIGFDSIEWYDETDISKEGSVKLSDEQYTQLIDCCNGLKALGPQRELGLGTTSIYLLYDGNVYASAYAHPEPGYPPRTPAELMELCELLIELSPIDID